MRKSTSAAIEKLLSKLIPLSKVRGEQNCSNIFSLIRSIDIYSALVQRSREKPKANLQEKEDFLFDVFSELQQRRVIVEQKPDSWIKRTRKIWKENIHLFSFSFVFFVASVMVGLVIGLKEPSLMSLFIDDSFREYVVDKESWFDRLSSNPVFYTFLIAFNNIKVALLAWGCGVIAGVGGLYILIFNGIYFGSIIGYSFRHDFTGIQYFVISHGPLELLIFIVCTGAGLIIGEKFYQGSLRDLSSRLGKASFSSIYIAFGALPWLICAAIIECFISPSKEIPLYLKFLTGIFLMMMYLLFLNGWEKKPKISV